MGVLGQITSWLRLGLLAGLACCLQSGSAAAATNAAWFARAWQSDEGLPDNTVVGVAQTPDGFLWVATQNSLVRFDGVRFREVEVANAPGLRVGENHGLEVDHRGRLWLVKNHGGAIRLDGPRSVSFSTKDGLPNALALNMAIDGQDNLWVAAEGQRVVRFQEGAGRPFTGVDGLPKGNRCRLVRDGKGELWFSTGGKVRVFRDGKFISRLAHGQCSYVT